MKNPFRTLFKRGKVSKEYCQTCGQRTVHTLEKDEQGELWKVCNKCKRREYMGTK